jgi:hypothetical protein
VTAKFSELAAARGPEFRSDTWNGLYDDANFPLLAAEWAGSARAAASGRSTATTAPLSSSRCCATTRT